MGGVAHACGHLDPHLVVVGEALVGDLLGEGRRLVGREPLELQVLEAVRGEAFVVAGGAGCDHDEEVGVIVLGNGEQVVDSAVDEAAGAG